MTLLRLNVDGATVVAIPTDGCNLLGVQIGGTRDDDDYADLSAWSGTYGQGDRDIHRIWLDHFKLMQGQLIKVEFAASGSQVGVGKPFDASGVSGPHPGHSHEDEIRALAQELRGKPWVRGSYKFRYVSPNSVMIDCLMAQDEYGFGFNVLWNDIRPNRVRVSLYAYTIDSMERRESGRQLASEHIPLDHACQLTLVA